MLKKALFFLLILTHVLINGVAASVHLTEDYQHEHTDTDIHKHFSIGDRHIIEDSCQHEQGDCAHMHPVYQLSETMMLRVYRTILSITSADTSLFTTNTTRPPIPPPIA